MLAPPINKLQQPKAKRPLREYYDHETQDTMPALYIFCRLGCRYRLYIKAIVQCQPELIAHRSLTGGDTPLHFAVAAQHLDTARMLLDTCPAAATIKSRKTGNFGNQMTPLHVAILANASFQVIDAVIQASPRPAKLRDGNGRTAAQLAAQYCDADNVAQVLASLDKYTRREHCSRGLTTPPSRPQCHSMLLSFHSTAA